MPFAMMGIGAWLYFLHPDWVDAGITNQGFLLSPPSSLQQLGFLEPEAGGAKWRVILVSPDLCTDACVRSAERIKSLPTLLGRDGGRLEMLLVLPGTARKASDDLAGWQTTMANQKQIEDALIAFGVPLVTGHYALLADPNGNVMLFYQSEQIGSELLLDLRRMLKLSTIG